MADTVQIMQGSSAYTSIGRELPGTPKVRAGCTCVIVVIVRGRIIHSIVPGDQKRVNTVHVPLCSKGLD